MKFNLNKFTKVFRRLGELQKKGLRTKAINKILKKEYKQEKQTMSDATMEILWFINEIMSIVVKVGITSLLWVLVPKLRLKHMIAKQCIDFNRIDV